MCGFGLGGEGCECVVCGCECCVDYCVVVCV